jgi:hypothetical protein
MSSRKRLAVWDHFEEDGNTPNKVMCRICRVVLTYNKSTSAMLKHLRSAHKDTDIIPEQRAQDLTDNNIPDTYPGTYICCSR